MTAVHLPRENHRPLFCGKSSRHDRSRHDSGAGGSDRRSTNIQSIRTSLDYTLQLGSFSQIENAQQLRDKLKSSYADVSIVPLQSKDVTYYRVQLGNFSNRNAAEEQARQLSQAGFPVIIMEK